MADRTTLGSPVRFVRAGMRVSVSSTVSLPTHDQQPFPAGMQVADTEDVGAGSEAKVDD